MAEIFLLYWDQTALNVANFVDNGQRLWQKTHTKLNFHKYRRVDNNVGHLMLEKIVCKLVQTHLVGIKRYHNYLIHRLDFYLILSPFHKRDGLNQDDLVFGRDTLRPHEINSNLGMG